MSSHIWTPAALSSEMKKPYERRVWRLVEAQHRVSSMLITAARKMAICHRRDSPEPVALPQPHDRAEPFHTRA
jgi:hypothetical protein